MPRWARWAAAHRLLQTAGVLVAAQVDQLDVMEQPGLEAQQIEAGGEGFEDGQLLAGLTGLHHPPPGRRDWL